MILITETAEGMLKKKKLIRLGEQQPVKLHTLRRKPATTQPVKLHTLRRKPAKRRIYKQQPGGQQLNEQQPVKLQIAKLWIGKIMPTRSMFFIYIFNLNNFL
jgi:uncharacterized protein YqfB (UPF0267 family)